MTMMLSFNHLSAAPIICGVGLIAIEMDVRACSNETRGAPAGMQFSVALAPTAALAVWSLSPCESRAAWRSAALGMRALA
jgi:hypothetical protein